MPICTIPYSVKDGAEIDVFISRPASLCAAESIKSSQRKLRLLIDTGASRTAINLRLIAEMQLSPIGKSTMRTGMGDTLVNLYPVDLIYETPQPPLMLRDLLIMEFKAQWRDGVLGRDFLENKILEINAAEQQAKLII